MRSNREPKGAPYPLLLLLLGSLVSVVAITISMRIVEICRYFCRCSVQIGKKIDKFQIPEREDDRLLHDNNGDFDGSNIYGNYTQRAE